MSRLFTLIVLVLLNAGAYWAWREFSRAPGVAEVMGQVISEQRFSEALRQHLFRRGIDWSSCTDDEKRLHRHEVLEQLADGVRLSVATQSVAADVQGVGVDEEFQDFIAEFDPEEEYRRRLELQQQTEPQLLTNMAMRQHELAWLEERLTQGMPKDSPTTTETVVPEVWRVRHFFLSAFEVGKPDRSAEIQAYHEKITSGTASLESLTALHSEDARTKARGGDLGWFSERRMPADFISELKKMAIGKMSAPFRTKLGWHIIQVIDHKAAQKLKTGEMATELRAVAEFETRSKALQTILTELRNAKGAEITLNPLLPLDSLEPL